MATPWAIDIKPDRPGGGYRIRGADGGTIRIYGTRADVDKVLASVNEMNFDRCARCGDTLIADGTEERDFATLCPDCDEEHRSELSGDTSEPLPGLE